MPKKSSGFPSLLPHIHALSNPDPQRSEALLSSLQALVAQSVQANNKASSRKEYAVFLDKKASKALISCLQSGPTSRHRVEVAKLLWFMSQNKTASLSLVSKGFLPTALRFLPGPDMQAAKPSEARVDLPLVNQLLSVLNNCAFHKEAVQHMLAMPGLPSVLCGLGRPEWGSSCAAQAFSALSNLAGLETAVPTLLQHGALTACVQHGLDPTRPLPVLSFSLQLLHNLSWAENEQ
eukprot:g28203.t1